MAPAVNCPACGKPLVLYSDAGSVQIYDCFTDGPVVRQADGRLVVSSAVRSLPPREPEPAPVSQQGLPTVFEVWPSCPDCRTRMMMVADGRRSARFVCGNCGRRAEIPH